MNNSLFYHGKTSDGYRFTIAGRFNTEELKDTDLSLGVSICSLNDNFCRKDGRDRATERMLKTGKGYVVIEGNFSKDKAIKDFMGTCQSFEKESSKVLKRIFNFKN